MHGTLVSHTHAILALAADMETQMQRAADDAAALRLRLDHADQRTAEDAELIQRLTAENLQLRARLVPVPINPHWARFEATYTMDQQTRSANSLTDSQRALGEARLHDITSVPTIPGAVARRIQSLLTGRSPERDTAAKGPRSAVDGRCLEYHSGFLMKAIGMDVIECGGAPHDGGVDIRCRDPTTSTDVIIQCKQYANSTVQVNVVRELLGSMVVLGVRTGILITTSTVASGCRELSAHIHRHRASLNAMELIVWDRDDLIHYLGLYAEHIVAARMAVIAELKAAHAVVIAQIQQEDPYFCVDHCLSRRREGESCSTTGCLVYTKTTDCNISNYRQRSPAKAANAARATPQTETILRTKSHLPSAGNSRTPVRVVVSEEKEQLRVAPASLRPQPRWPVLPADDDVTVDSTAVDVSALTDQFLAARLDDIQSEIDRQCECVNRPPALSTEITDDVTSQLVDVACNAESADQEASTELLPILHHHYLIDNDRSQKQHVETSMNERNSDDDHSDTDSEADRYEEFRNEAQDNEHHRLQQQQRQQRDCEESVSLMIATLTVNDVEQAAVASSAECARVTVIVPVVDASSDNDSTEESSVVPGAAADENEGPGGVTVVIPVSVVDTRSVSDIGNDIGIPLSFAPAPSPLTALSRVKLTQWQQRQRMMANPNHISDVSNSEEEEANNNDSEDDGSALEDDQVHSPVHTTAAATVGANASAGSSGPSAYNPRRTRLQWDDTKECALMAAVAAHWPLANRGSASQPQPRPAKLWSTIGKDPQYQKLFQLHVDNSSTALKDKWVNLVRAKKAFDPTVRLR